MNIVVLLIVLILLIIGYSWYKKNFKKLDIPCVAMVTGAPKCGKSTIAIHLAYKEFKKARFKVAVKNIFNRLMHKPLLEKPLFYSNIPLNIKEGYTPVTKELLTAQTKFVEFSVVYLGEVSLIADSMSYRNEDINEQLLLFNKLFGHRVGGKLFYDTQCINDCHYSLKRVVSNYLYCYKLVNLPILPFVIAYVREERYSDDNSTINTFESDVEDSLKKILISKNVWKKFDYRCYRNIHNYKSLKEECDIIHTNKLEANNIVSFKNYKTLEVNKNENAKS